MACRIGKTIFEGMVRTEAAALGLKKVEIDQRDPVEAFSMVEVVEQYAETKPTAILNRKAIQSLVDEAEQARPIVRNLLRWAKEHGAK